MQYERSAEIEKVARSIIKEHLSDLESKTIVYIAQDKKDDKTGVAVPQMRKGKPIIADIKLVQGLNAFLASGEDRTDYDGPMPLAVLVVSRHAWNQLKPEQRKAYVHQQLCRLDYNVDTGKPSLVEYEVKEFSSIAKLYGAYNDDLSALFKIANKHPLFEDLPIEETPAQSAASKAKVVKAETGDGNGKEKAAAANQESGAPAGNLKSLKDEVAARRGIRKPHPGN
jgi:hypothetical protein